MQFKEHEKVAIKVPADAESAAQPDADSFVGNGQVSPPALAPDEQAASTQADSSKADHQPSPVSAAAKSRDFSFGKIPAALKMLDLNPAGMMCICLVISIVLSAFILPKLDNETNVDTRSWLNKIEAGDAALATRALAIDKTDAKALNSIAFSYMLGDGVKVDHPKAIEYFQQSAKLGNTDGMLFYGILTHSHLRKQQRESQNWIDKAVAAGNLNALEFEFRRKYNMPTDDNYKKYKPAQIKLLKQLCTGYKQLADLGDTNGIWGYMRLSRSENARYLNSLEQNAKTGDRTAQYLIGYRYVEKAWPDYWTLQVPPRDNAPSTTTYKRMQDTPLSKYLLGFEYLKTAGSSGFVPAESALHSAYYQYGDAFSNPFENPEIFEVCSQKQRCGAIARAWRERAAMQNDPRSNMFIEYDLRWNLSGDRKKAIQYGRTSLKNGGFFAHRQLGRTFNILDLPKDAFDESMAALGTTRARLATDVDGIMVDKDCDIGAVLEDAAEALLRGAGTVQDVDLAKRLMKRLAEAGGTENYEKVGKFLTSTGNPTEALPYLLKADTASSLYEYGRIICRGNSSEADMQAGIAALLRAKGKGSTDAAVLLGDIYNFGRGVKQNHKLASEYYIQAAGKVDMNGSQVPYDTRRAASAAMMRMGDICERADATTANKEKAIAWYRNALKNYNEKARTKLQKLGASEHASTTDSP